VSWERLIGRLRFLQRERPDLSLPAVDDAALRDLAVELAPGCRSLAELRRSDWEGALMRRLSHGDRLLLERYAPEAVPVRGGRLARLDYPVAGPPVLAVKMQDLFGVSETPRVAGRPVLLHLLAPNGRPQQVTDDLGGFWARTWPEVRKELRARYPKHAWPEDPRVV